MVGFDPNNPRSQCKYCKNQYKCHGKKNGTSGMLQHMKVCKKWPFPCDDKQKTLSFQAKREGESGLNVLVVANYSEERVRLALVRMIVIDELPFKFVEHQGFQEFMEIVEPRFPILHCTTIGRAIESCLLKWGIDRLFTITTDNASSNEVAIDYVKKKTKKKR